MVQGAFSLVFLGWEARCSTGVAPAKVLGFAGHAEETKGPELSPEALSEYLFLVREPVRLRHCAHVNVLRDEIPSGV